MIFEQAVDNIDLTGINYERLDHCVDTMDDVIAKGKNFNISHWRRDHPDGGMSCCFGGWLGQTKRWKKAGGELTKDVTGYNVELQGFQGSAAIQAYLGLEQAKTSLLELSVGAWLTTPRLYPHKGKTRPEEIAYRLRLVKKAAKRQLANGGPIMRDMKATRKTMDWFDSQADETRGEFVVYSPSSHFVRMPNEAATTDYWRAFVPAFSRAEQLAADEVS